MSIRRLLRQVQRDRTDADPVRRFWTALLSRPCDELPAWFVAEYGDLFARAAEEVLDCPIERAIREAAEQ